eukprot:COSAG03_NODE_448_length_7836_cov_82.194649_8_plen_240_part_00
MTLGEAHAQGTPRGDSTYPFRPQGRLTIPTTTGEAHDPDDRKGGSRSRRPQGKGKERVLLRPSMVERVAIDRWFHHHLIVILIPMRSLLAHHLGGQHTDRQTVCVSAGVSVCLPACLSVCLSVCLSACLSAQRTFCSRTTTPLRPADVRAARKGTPRRGRRLTHEARSTARRRSSRCLWAPLAVYLQPAPAAHRSGHARMYSDAFSAAPRSPPRPLSCQPRGAPPSSRAAGHSRRGIDR